MHVLAVEMELRIPHAHSLKDKRQVVKSLVEGARHRFGVSSAETGRQESWQRSTLGFAIVTSSPGLAESVMDDIDRFVWSRGDVEVVSAERVWLG